MEHLAISTDHSLTLRRSDWDINYCRRSINIIINIIIFALAWESTPSNLSGGVLLRIPSVTRAQGLGFQNWPFALEYRTCLNWPTNDSHQGGKAEHERHIAIVPPVTGFPSASGQGRVSRRVRGESVPLGVVVRALVSWRGNIPFLREISENTCPFKKRIFKFARFKYLFGYPFSMRFNLNLKN